MNKIKNLKPRAFQEAVTRAQDSVILDVRSPQEAQEGVIEGAQLINFFDSDFADKISQLDKSKRYFVYCRSGNRSMKACDIMYNMGFEHLTNLNGGMMAWNADNIKIQ